MTTQAILTGITSSQFFNAITSLIIIRSANAERACGITFWLLGNLSDVHWPDAVLAIPIVLVDTALCFCYARHPDAFSFGAESATPLGIPVRCTRAVLTAVVTGMTAIMAPIVGAIGFVGLVTPHAARLLVGNQHHRPLSVSVPTGATFLIIADVISRMLLPDQALSIGVITTLVGTPVSSIIPIRRNQNK